MPLSKHPSSYRLSEECRRLIGELSTALGISQAGVIEQAVRKLARAELPGDEAVAPPSAPKPPAVEPTKPPSKRKARAKKGST
jgi:hypothetical protein